jgi:type I restriction-modification system DNA methylase subunit
MKFEGKVLVKEEGRETIKNPDLDFKMGPKTMFYVEIKPPHIRVPDTQSAFQLRRYAWSKKGLPVSILTNFENFCVYDTRYKPDINDNPRVALVKEINHKDYIKEFEYLWNTFGYEAVRGGSIEKFAEETKDKRGHTDVDDAFLKDIENFRYLLAKNIALRNPPGKPFGASPINIYQLNDVVQKTIDRIIFLRVCEDRDIEQYGNLKDIVDEGSDIYERLMLYFGRTENRYNAGLFNLREDPHKTSPHIVIDDVVLSEIINSLYYPDSPYAFNAIPVEILGQVYERFLGKTIRLTPSGQAKIEDKPEVRKAGGIYYTPKYIVDYIVENTVGRILGGLDMKLSHPPGGKKPSQVKKIRILDPACGSGSFLLGAYGYLLRWYLERYIEDKDKYLDKTIYKVGDDDYRLMIDERKRILMEHIFGVDIDPQAVEVTKLSLHLKVLEGETGETLDGQLALIREPALPDLERNIRCGNSLIGPDFYKQFDIGLFDDDEIRRINVFDWNDDERGFGEIMREGGSAPGGFDAVIGNPPYGAELYNEKYMINKYPYSSEMKEINTYLYFIEQGINLLKHYGILGFIIPNTVLYKSQYKEFRSFLSNNVTIEEIIETGPVFNEAKATPNIMLFVSKILPNNEKLIDRRIIDYKKSSLGLLADLSKKEFIEIGKLSYKDWKNSYLLTLGKYVEEKKIRIIVKIVFESKSIRDIDGININRGLEGGKSSLKGKGKYEILIPDNIYQYYISETNYYTNEYHNSFDKERILIIRIRNIKISQRIVAAFEDNKRATLKTLQQIFFTKKEKYNLKFILGILNSKIVNYYCNHFLIDDLNKYYLENLPIRTIDFNNPGDVKMHDEMVHLVDRMMDLKKRYYETSDERLRQQLDHAINATDEQIDHLVYKLYNLTDDEISVVEGG